MAEGKKNVCVLGAGIIGMTTAYLIKEKHSDWDVTIIADKFNDQTLSHIAAGIFRPSTSFSGPTPEITKFVGLSFSLSFPYLSSLIFIILGNGWSTLTITTRTFKILLRHLMLVSWKFPATCFHPNIRK